MKYVKFSEGNVPLPYFPETCKFQAHCQSSSNTLYSVIIDNDLMLYVLKNGVCKASSKVLGELFEEEPILTVSIKIVNSNQLHHCFVQKTPLPVVLNIVVAGNDTLYLLNWHEAIKNSLSNTLCEPMLCANESNVCTDSTVRCARLDQQKSPAYINGQDLTFNSLSADPTRQEKVTNHTNKIVSSSNKTDEPTSHDITRSNFNKEEKQEYEFSRKQHPYWSSIHGTNVFTSNKKSSEVKAKSESISYWEEEERPQRELEKIAKLNSKQSNEIDSERRYINENGEKGEFRASYNNGMFSKCECNNLYYRKIKLDFSRCAVINRKTKHDREDASLENFAETPLHTMNSGKCGVVKDMGIVKIHYTEFVTENEICLLLCNEVLFVRFELIKMEEKQETNANQEFSANYTQNRWADLVLWKLHGCFTKLAVEPTNLYIALVEPSAATITVIFPWYKKVFRKHFTNFIMEIPLFSRKYADINKNLVEGSDALEEFECTISWLQVNSNNNNCNNLSLCIQYDNKYNQSIEYSFKENVQSKSTCSSCINADDTANTKYVHNESTEIETTEYSVDHSRELISHNEVKPTIYFYQFRTHVPIHKLPNISTRDDLISSEGTYRDSNIKREKEVKFTDNISSNELMSSTEQCSSVNQAQFNDAFHALCSPITTKPSTGEREIVRESTSPIAPLSTSSAVTSATTTAAAATSVIDSAKEPESNEKREFINIISPTHFIELPQSSWLKHWENTEWEMNNKDEVKFERSEIVPLLLGKIELECNELISNASFDDNFYKQKEDEESCEADVEWHWHTQVVPTINVENELSTDEKYVHMESCNQSLQLMHIHSTGLVYTSNYSISQNDDWRNNINEQRSAHRVSSSSSSSSSRAKLLTPLCDLYGYISSVEILPVPRVNQVEIGHAFANQHTCNQTNCTYCVLLTFQKSEMKILTMMDLSSWTFEILCYLNYGKGKIIESFCTMKEFNLNTILQEEKCALYSPHINLVAVLYKEYHAIPICDCNKRRMVEEEFTDDKIATNKSELLQSKNEIWNNCNQSRSSKYKIATENQKSNIMSINSSGDNDEQINKFTDKNNNKNTLSFKEKSEFAVNSDNHLNLINSGGVMLFVQETVASQIECTLLTVAPFTNEELKNVESVICRQHNRNSDDNNKDNNNSNNNNKEESIEAETLSTNFTQQTSCCDISMRNQECGKEYIERSLEYFYHDGNNFLFAIKCTAFYQNVRDKVERYNNEAEFSYRCLCQMRTLNGQKKPSDNKNIYTGCSAYTPTAARVLVLQYEKIDESELYRIGNLRVLKTRCEAQSEHPSKTPTHAKSCTLEKELEEECKQNELVNGNVNGDYFKQNNVNVNYDVENTNINKEGTNINSNLDITPVGSNDDNKRHSLCKVINQDSELFLQVFAPLLPVDGVKLSCFAELDKEYGEECIKMCRVLETKVVQAANHDTLIGVIIQGIYFNQERGEYFDEKLFLFALLAFQSLSEDEYEFKLEAVYNHIHSFYISELGEVLLIDNKASSVTRYLRCFPTFGRTYYYIIVESWNISEHWKNASHEESSICSSTLIPWETSMYSRQEQFVQLLYAVQGINHLYLLTIPFTTSQENYFRNINTLEHKNNNNNMICNRKQNMQYHPDVIMQLVGIGEWRLIRAIFAKIEEAAHKCMRETEENYSTETETKENKDREQWYDASEIIHHLLRPHKIKMAVNHFSKQCSMLEPLESTSQHQSASSAAPTSTNYFKKKARIDKTSTDEHMCGVIKVNELTTTEIINLIRKNDISNIIANSGNNNNNITKENKSAGQTSNTKFTVNSNSFCSNYNYFNSQQQQQRQLCKHERKVNLIDVFGRYNTYTNNHLDDVTFDHLSCILTQFSLYGLNAETQLELLCIVNALAQSVTLSANVDEAGARFFFFHKLRLIRARLHLSDHVRENTCSTNHYHCRNSKETANVAANAVVAENKYVNNTNSNKNNYNTKLCKQQDSEFDRFSVCCHANTSQTPTEAHTLVDFVRSKLATRIIPEYHFVWALLSDSQSVLLTQLLESMTTTLPTSTHLTSISSSETSKSTPLMQHNYPIHIDSSKNYSYSKSSHNTLSSPAAKTWSWELVEMTGIPYWVTSGETLRHIAEQLARHTYKTQLEHKDIGNETESRHQRAIEASALMFVISRRISTLAALCNVNGNGKSGGLSTNTNKLAAFFSRNFEESRHQAAASANGYAALGKGKHEYAAAFFILAHDHRSAVQVLLQRCHNPTLALFVLRTVLSSQPEHTTWRYSLHHSCIVNTESDLNENRVPIYKENDCRNVKNYSNISTYSVMESELRWYKEQRSSESAECGRANLWEEFCIDWLMGSTRAKIGALQMLIAHPTGLPEILSVTRYIRDNVSGVAEHGQEYLSAERELVCCARLGRFCLSRGLIMTAIIHYSDAQELLWQLRHTVTKEENTCDSINNNNNNNNSNKKEENSVNRVISETHNTPVEHVNMLRNRSSITADVNTGILHFTGFDSESEDDDSNINNSGGGDNIDSNTEQKRSQGSIQDNKGYRTNNEECENAIAMKVTNVTESESLATTDNKFYNTERKLTAYMKGVVQTELTYAMQTMRTFDKDSRHNFIHDKMNNNYATTTINEGGGDDVVFDDNQVFDMKLCYVLSTMFVNHLISATPLANASENLALVLSIASEWWTMNVEHGEQCHTRGKENETVQKNLLTPDTDNFAQEYSQENMSKMIDWGVSYNNAANNDFYTLFIVILFVIFASVAVEHAHFLLANALMHVLEQHEVILRGVTFKHTWKLSEHTTILHPVASFFSTLQECFKAEESMYEATILQQEQQQEEYCKESENAKNEDSNNGILCYGESTTSKTTKGNLFNNELDQLNMHNNTVNDEEDEKSNSDNDDNGVKSTKIDFATLHRSLWETITTAANAAGATTTNNIFISDIVNDSSTQDDVANKNETRARSQVESKENSSIIVQRPSEEIDKAILLEEFSVLLKMRLLKLLHDVWNREKERNKYKDIFQHTQCSVTDCSSDHSGLPTINKNNKCFINSIYVRHKSLFHLLLASLTLHMINELSKSIDVHCRNWLRYQELCIVTIESLSSYISTLNGVFVKVDRKNNKWLMQLCTNIRVELSKLYKYITMNDMAYKKHNPKLEQCCVENTNDLFCMNKVKRNYAPDNALKPEESKQTNESDDECHNDMMWDVLMNICESNYVNHWLEEEKSICNKRCVLFNTHVIDARITRLTKINFYAYELQKLLAEMIVNSNTDNQTVCTDTLPPSPPSQLSVTNVTKDNSNIVETCNIGKLLSLSHSSSPVIATSGSFPWHSLQNVLESSESSLITNCLLAIMERFYLIRHHTHQTLRRLLLSLSFQMNITSSISYKDNHIAIRNSSSKDYSNCNVTCTLPKVSTIDRLILGQSTHSITTIGFDNASCDSIIWSSEAGTHVSHGFREVLAHDNEVVLRRQSAQRSATILSFSESLAQQQHAFSSLSSTALVDKTNKNRVRWIQTIKEGHNVLQTRPLTGVSANAQPSPHPHLPFFLTSSRDHFVDLYSFASAECVSTFICPSFSTHPITQAVYTVHGEHFAAGLSDGSIAVWHFRASATPATPAVYVPLVFTTNGIKNLTFCDHPFLNRRHYYNSNHSSHTTSSKLVIAALGLVQESNDNNKTTYNIVSKNNNYGGNSETEFREEPVNCKEEQKELKMSKSLSQQYPVLPISSSSSTLFPAPHSPRFAYEARMSKSLTSPASKQITTSRKETSSVDAKQTLNKNIIKSTIVGEVVIISICNKEQTICNTSNTAVPSPLPSTNINVKCSCDNKNNVDNVNDCNEKEESWSSESNYGTIRDNINKSQSNKKVSVNVEQEVQYNEYEATVIAKCALPFTPEFCVYIRSLDSLFIVSCEGFIATYEIKVGKLTIIGEINVESLLWWYCEVDTATTTIHNNNNSVNTNTNAFADKNATNVIRAYLTDYFVNRASPIKITALAMSSYDDLIAIGTSIGLSFMLTLEEVEEYMKEVHNYCLFGNTHYQDHDANNNINDDDNDDVDDELGAANASRCAPSSLRLSSSTIITHPWRSEIALRKSNKDAKRQYGITHSQHDIKINIPATREFRNAELNTPSSTVTSTSNSIFSTVASLFTKGSNKYKGTEVEYLTHSAQPANCHFYYSILLRSTIIQITPMFNTHCGIYSLCFAPSVLLAGLQDGKVIAASLVPNALRQFITSGIAAVK